VQATRALQLSEQAHAASDALDLTQALDLALSDRVAAVRDYLISGDDAALDVYADANGRFNQALSGLRAMLTEPAQVQQLARAEQVAAVWETEVAEPGIALRRQTLQTPAIPYDSVIAFYRREGRSDALAASAEIGELRAEQSALEVSARDRRDDAIRQIRNATAI